MSDATSLPGGQVLRAKAEKLIEIPFNGLGLWTEDEQCLAAEVIRDLLALLSAPVPQRQEQKEDQSRVDRECPSGRPTGSTASSNEVVRARVEKHLAECEDLIDFHTGASDGVPTIKSEGDEVAALRESMALIQILIAEIEQ